MSIREFKQGVLPNGETIAVKKLNSSMPEVTDKQFKNEAYHLIRLKHPNIVLLEASVQKQRTYMSNAMANTFAMRSRKGCFAWSSCLKETFVGMFRV